MSKADEYASLLEFCQTEKEVELINLLSNGMTRREAGEAVGLALKTIENRITRIRKRASLRGWSPMHDMVKITPETHFVKGTSTLYDGDGNQRLQWVKTDKTKEDMVEVMREIVDAMKADIQPETISIGRTGVIVDENLLNLYTLSDVHIGMYAWAEEGGADWNLEIAEKTIINTFKKMIEQSPSAHTCIINNLGDWLHSTGMLPVTPTSNNVLDQSSRFPQMVRSSIKVIRQIIYMALQKHEHVHVKMMEGNHDDSSSVWLKEMFSVLFELNDRVSVDTSPKPFAVYEFGKVMLGFHHGHKKQNPTLPLMFASEFSDVWGRTTYRIAHTGHRHHQEIKEHSGMTVEQHSTIAARDAHASRGGWHSMRRTNCITYHRKYGEVGRIYISPEMLEM